VPGAVFADEIKVRDIGQEEAVYEEEAYEEEKEIYEFPEIKPALSVSTGYRFIGLKGSARAAEYEYLHNSITLSEELRAVSFPHRLHLDIELRSKKDFLGEATYAFKDMFYFRGINRTLFHNLDNISLKDLDPSTPSPGVDVTDAGKKYAVKTSMNNLFFRFKTPDFPSHLYIDASMLERKGVAQQISLAGSGYRNDNVRKSRERDVDWQTRNVVIGINSHLGPVELDISHSEKRFDAGKGSVLYEDFTAANSIPPRAPGRYPYGLVPELTGSSDTIKLHTSYTGGLVATATVSRIERENNYSGSQADYFIGAGEVIWMPITKLAFFFRYRHKETDLDNPDTVTLRDVTNPLNSYTYGVRPSISSKINTASVAVRYRLSSFLTLKPEYTFDDMERENAGLWSIPGSTQRQIFSLAADTRVLKSLNLKASYFHKEINNPAYNIEPDRSDEGRIALSWMPLQRINTLLSYNLAAERRDRVRYLDQAGNTVLSPDNRDVLRGKVFGSVSFILNENICFTTSYADMHSKTRQDISYRTSSAPLVNSIDARVPYKEDSQNYAADISYMPKNNINISAGVSHTVSNSRFYPAAKDLLEPVSIASFSDLKTKDTIYSFSGEYRFKGELKLGTTYKYCSVKDALANPYDDLENGTAHILMVTISKGF